jgi:S-methylmethionine-dependent homocysteine/selenocysteine methylase
MTAHPAPTLLGRADWVTDGGLETDLIFHHGAELVEFAAYPLVRHERGRQLLADYFDGYADIARRAAAGLLLEAPTWRANPEWGARLGDDAAALDRVNREAVALLHERRDAYPDLHAQGVLVGGMVGPREDGYDAAAATTPEEYADYHGPQLAAFRAADADFAAAYTLTGGDEAVGVVLAARAVGLPVAISFTVEADGRLPDGSRLGDTVDRVDRDAPPDWYLVNCAHPTHVAAAVDGGGWQRRVVGLRPNASRLSHAELDGAEELDEGDPAELVASFEAIRPRFPALRVVGGCCGTDARHVAGLWGV